MRNFVDFGWEVTASGYQVIKTAEAPPREHHQPARYLTDGILPGDRCTRRLYPPLWEHPELFQRFSLLDPAQEESIVTFANSYGLLGETVRIFLPQRDTQAGPPVGRGERLSVWHAAIIDMKYAVELWGWLKLKDRKALSKVIRWRGGEVYYVVGQSAIPLTLVVNKEISPARLPFGKMNQFRQGDLVEPAWARLQHTINEHLEGGASPRLLWRRSPIKRRTHDHSTPGVFFAPHTLLDALWLQFADTVDGNRDVRWCVYCGDPFIVGTGTGEKRSHAKHCKPSCQKLDWQTQKRQASTRERTR